MPRINRSRTRMPQIEQITVETPNLEIHDYENIEHHQPNQWPLVYCVKCKEKLPVHDAHLVATRNNKMRIVGLCPSNHNVSQFISTKYAQM